MNKILSGLFKVIRAVPVTFVELIIIFFLISLVVKEHKEAEELTYVAENANSEINVSVLTEEIQAIGELATIEYMYTDANKFSKAKDFNNFDIPLTTKSFVVKYDGNIKAGVDVTKLTASVDKSNKTIKIRIPPAQILSNEVDNDSVETVDENNNILNLITVDDVNAFIGDSKKFMEEKAIDNGLLEKAADNAKVLIEKFIESNKDLGDYKVNIEISGD